MARKLPPGGLLRQPLVSRACDADLTANSDMSVLRSAGDLSPTPMLTGTKRLAGQQRSGFEASFGEFLPTFGQEACLERRR
jgi:hypothetical protein